MHRPKIFLVGDDKEHLITLEETGYVREEVLQDYLVDYPDLLPGDQIDPENPWRWLLVAQEMGVPGEEEGSSRWSLDHLFLDQDGIPTFVECKRSSDTRARREVVAQMLDYAANGIEYWSMDRLRQAAAETAQRQGQSLDEQIVGLLDDDEASIEEYWDAVETNLRAHRVRLVFVADSTPKELRRMAEFLNEEMTNVSVLAVEVKQYQRRAGEGQRALVPRVIGLTEAAREKSSRPARSNITQPEFLAGCTPLGRRFFQRVIELAQDRGHIVYWGKSRFSVRARFPISGQAASFAYATSAATHTLDVDEFQFYFGDIASVASKDEASAWRQRLLHGGVFRGVGQWSVKAIISEETMSYLDQAYDAMLNEIDKFVRAHDFKEATE
jgi:hypothetical protein